MQEVNTAIERDQIVTYSKTTPRAQPLRSYGAGGGELLGFGNGNWGVCVLRYTNNYTDRALGEGSIILCVWGEFGVYALAYTPTNRPSGAPTVIERVQLLRTQSLNIDESSYTAGN